MERNALPPPPSGTGAVPPHLAIHRTDWDGTSLRHRVGTHVRHPWGFIMVGRGESQPAIASRSPSPCTSTQCPVAPQRVQDGFGVGSVTPKMNGRQGANLQNILGVIFHLLLETSSFDFVFIFFGHPTHPWTGPQNSWERGGASQWLCICDPVHRSNEINQ